MATVVTIGIPIYKRLHYLAQAVMAVKAQDYPHIELLVSDNGQNGTKVPEIVEQVYGRPFRFRQNAATVNVIQHYNQILEEASGEYFVMMDDDDSISPNFVSDLIKIMEGNPEISLAMTKQVVLDDQGRIIGRSSEQIPSLTSGEQFVRGLFEYGFSNYTSFLARTAEIRACGGYNDFPRGFHSETALIVKLCLNRLIACSQQSTFFARQSATSLASSMELHELAEASRLFLDFLDSDPWVQLQLGRHPTGWAELKDRLAAMAWGGYLQRWEDLYRGQLPYLSWVRSGFALPCRLGACSAIAGGLMRNLKFTAFMYAKRWLPGIFHLYRARKDGDV